MLNFVAMLAPKKVTRSYQSKAEPFKQRVLNNPWYHTHRWRVLAAQAKSMQPLCVECRVPHELSKGDPVDHICPVSIGRSEAERYLIMWEPTNLKPMCKKAHALKSQREANITTKQKQILLEQFYERRK